MASGRLANTYLSTTANTLVYTVPAAKIAVATISVVNLSSNPSKLYLALTTNASNAPDNSEYLEYGTSIAADGGVFEKTGVVISPNMKVVAQAPAANTLAISVYGFEQDQ